MGTSLITGSSSTGNVGSDRQPVDMSPKRKKVKKDKQRHKKKIIKLGLTNFSI